MAKVCELARPVAPTATGRAGRCSKRRGIEACPKLSRASSCLFLGRSRSTSLRHPRFPASAVSMNSARPLPGSSFLSPGNASRLGLDRMRFMSFHVCRRGDLKGYSPPPRGSSSVPSYGYQRRDQHYQPTHRGQSAARLYEPRAARRGYTVFPRNRSAGLVWAQEATACSRHEVVLGFNPSSGLVASGDHSQSLATPRDERANPARPTAAVAAPSARCQRPPAVGPCLPYPRRHGQR